MQWLKPFFSDSSESVFSVVCLRVLLLAGNPALMWWWSSSLILWFSSSRWSRYTYFVTASISFMLTLITCCWQYSLNITFVLLMFILSPTASLCWASSCSISWSVLESWPMMVMSSVKQRWLRYMPLILMPFSCQSSSWKTCPRVAENSYVEAGSPWHTPLFIGIGSAESCIFIIMVAFTYIFAKMSQYHLSIPWMPSAYKWACTMR